MERKGLLEFRGQEVTVIGEDIHIGEKAPDFSVMTRDWSWVKPLEAYKEKVRIVGSLPSLSTDVCDRETRHFNEAATSLSDEIEILMVSMDLPFTLNQWCAGAGIDRVVTFSDHFHGEFGKNYGVLIKEFRIFRRAIFVIDRKGIAIHSQYLPALGEEPDYERVLDIAHGALV